jgi:hypothetical protein
MAHVPNQAIARGIEDPVQRHRQLDHAKASPEVTAGDGHRVDGFLAQFVGQLPQLLFGQPAQIVRGDDLVQKRSFAWMVHA